MEFKEVVDGRRSIRRYNSCVISNETISEIVLDAQKAPSWKNSQVSKFYAVNSKENLEIFAEFLPSFNKNSTQNAGAYIVSTVVNGISGFNLDGSYSTNLKEAYQFFDNGLSVENLCLSAYNHGYGTLIMGLFDEQKIREFFSIPENEIIVTVVSVGTPAVDPTMPKRKPLDEILKIK